MICCQVIWKQTLCELISFSICRVTGYKAVYRVSFEVEDWFGSRAYFYKRQEVAVLLKKEVDQTPMAVGSDSAPASLQEVEIFFELENSPDPFDCKNTL